MQHQTRRKWLKRTGKTLLVLLVLLMLLRWFEHSQVYYPDRTMVASADALGRPAKDLFLTASDGVRIHAWFFPGNTNSPRSRLAILQCHGNAGNISHRLDHFAALLETGASLLVFDYRGYGRSEGHPGEQGTYLDVAAAHAWLVSEGFAPSQIVVLGESLGGGIASQVASTKPVGGLVLQSTFTSIPDIGAELFPWLPVKTLASIHYDTHSRLSDIHVPVMVMHSRTDEIIGFHHGERNFAAANEPKRFVELSGGHNDWLDASREKYIDAWKAFLDMIAANQPSPHAKP